MIYSATQESVKEQNNSFEIILLLLKAHVYLNNLSVKLNFTHSPSWTYVATAALSKVDFRILIKINSESSRHKARTCIFEHSLCTIFLIFSPSHFGEKSIAFYYVGQLEVNQPKVLAWLSKLKSLIWSNGACSAIAHSMHNFMIGEFGKIGRICKIQIKCLI